MAKARTPAPSDRLIAFKPIDVTELAQADARLRALQQAWADALSPEEAAALGDYKAALGRDINAQLRGAMSDNRLETRARLLRGALRRAHAPSDMLLHCAAGPDEADFYRRQKNGAQFKAIGFLSASLAPAVATKLAGYERGALMELIVRGGQKGVAYVHPFPAYRFRQYEVLLVAGIGLKVLGGDDQVIRLEVGDGNDSD